MDVRFTWSEDKRHSNLVKHGLDFADAEQVFDGAIFTIEDTRFWYGEKRYISVGLLHHLPVYIAHTENAEEIRIISFRRATRRETSVYFEKISH
jgi:uncharacterized DUF497 family protein